MTVRTISELLTDAVSEANFGDESFTHTMTGFVGRNDDDEYLDNDGDMGGFDESYTAVGSDESEIEGLTDTSEIDGFTVVPFSLTITVGSPVIAGQAPE